MSTWKRPPLMQIELLHVFFGQFDVIQIVEVLFRGPA